MRALKGPGRPLNSADDRAEVLAALACVDFVTIFDEPRATHLLAQVRPHVYVKGGDYRWKRLTRGTRRAAGRRRADRVRADGAGTLHDAHHGADAGRKAPA